MKTKTDNNVLVRVWQITAACGIILWSAGCASNGYDKGNSAGRSLQNAAGDVQAEGRILDSTIAALNDLVNNPAPDLKPQFHRYSSSLQHLISSAKRNDKTITKINARNAEYFEVWDKQLGTINYEVIRTRSEARKAEVVSQFDKVNGRYQEVQTTMDPLLNYLVDIRKALSADLTQDGLESVRGIVGNATDNTGKVQIALGKLADNLHEAGLKMTSVASSRNVERPPVAIQQ
jgi:hypothetical protein